MKKRFISIASAVLTFSLLFTSCSKSSSKKDKKGDSDVDEEIVSVFEGYEKQIKKLSTDKIGKYVSSSELDDLDLSGDEEDICKALLKKAKIEVTETEITEKKKSSTCTAKVKVNYVDLEKVLDGIDGQADIDDIISAIEDAKLSKKTVEIELETEDDEWLITEDSAITDLLFNGLDDLDYYLSPIETTPTTTEEPTTTTTEEPTTTTTETTSEPDSSTTPVISGDHQVLVGAELDKVLKDFGFTADETDYGDEKDVMYEYDEDFIFYYYESSYPDYIKEEYDDYVDDFRSMKPDCEEFIEDTYKGTLNIVMNNVKTENNHSYDFYIYYDESVLLIAGIDVYPNADPSVSYYELIQTVGLWDFGFDT